MQFLLWWSVAVGLIGGLNSFRRTRSAIRSTQSLPSPLLAFAALAMGPLLFAAVEFGGLPQGVHWARGFLLGSAGASVASWLMWCAGAEASEEAPIFSATTGALAATLPVVALPLLVLPATDTDSLVAMLLGTALGWIAVVVLLLHAHQTATSPSAQTAGASAPWVAHCTFVAGFIVLLCCTAALGFYRDTLYSTAGHGAWSTLAVATGAALVLVLTVNDWLEAHAKNAQPVFTMVAPPSLETARAETSARGRRLVLSLLLAAGLVCLLAIGVLGASGAWPRVALLSLLGLVGGLLLCWLARENHSSAGIVVPPLGILLVAAGTMTAHLMLQGFGAGLLLVSACLPLVLILPVSQTGDGEATTHPDRVGERIVGVMVLGSALVLFYLFRARFVEVLQDATFNDHYALFGFLIGAFLPALPGFRGFGGKETKSAGRLASLALTFAMALLVLAALLLVWGAQCAPALMMGLALSCALADRDTSAYSDTLVKPLCALALALAMTQWAGDLIPFADLPRMARLRILGGAGGALALIGLIYWWSNWLRRKPAGVL